MISKVRKTLKPNEYKVTFYTEHKVTLKKITNNYQIACNISDGLLLYDKSMIENI